MVCAPGLLYITEAAETRLDAEGKAYRIRNDAPALLPRQGMGVKPEANIMAGF
jgi:uncharacterized protein YbaR (Trm112 family)